MTRQRAGKNNHTGITGRLLLDEMSARALFNGHTSIGVANSIVDLCTFVAELWFPGVVALAN